MWNGTIPASFYSRHRRNTGSLWRLSHLLNCSLCMNDFSSGQGNSCQRGQRHFQGATAPRPPPPKKKKRLIMTSLAKGPWETKNHDPGLPELAFKPRGGKPTRSCFLRGLREPEQASHLWARGFSGLSKEPCPSQEGPNPGRGFYFHVLDDLPSASCFF